MTVWWHSLSADVAAGRIVVLIARVVEGAVAAMPDGTLTPTTYFFKELT